MLKTAVLGLAGSFATIGLSQVAQLWSDPAAFAVIVVVIVGILVRGITRPEPERLKD